MSTVDVERTAVPDVSDLPPVQVRVIDPADHAAFAQAGSHSFLQTPAWAAVKPGWRPQSLGWFHGDRLVGSALVLYRRVPGTRRSLAYVPEGPCLPWAQVSSAPAAWLDPFVSELRAQGAFAVRIGPQLVTHEWEPQTVKRGLAAGHADRFADLAPDVQNPVGVRLAAALRARGWKPLAAEHTESEAGGGGFGASQPQFTVRIPLGERSEAELLAASNQQWRRNIHRAERAGVVVREGNIDDLGTFHRLYAETAARDGFTPRRAGDPDGWRAGVRLRCLLRGAPIRPSLNGTAVAGKRWTEQLTATAATWPGLVPVVKGNGYGFGNARLAQRATAIGADTIAVGTVAEVDVVRACFAGSILVMAPLTPSEASRATGVTDLTGVTGVSQAPGLRGVIRTVASASVVESLASQGSSEPVVLEIDSAVHRHGIPASSIGALAPAIRRLPLAGLALHLPAGGDRRHLIQETARTVLDVRAAGIEPRLLWLSHVSRAEMLALQQQLPWMQVQVRMGTGLWLGDRSSFTASGAVLDHHRVPRRQLIGYRQRRCPAGTILVVSGGTAHGVGLHAGAAQGSWRALVRAAVAGAAHGAGLTSSPFHWQGRRLRYADVPHMQVSMLLVPADVTPPAVGDRLECDVRMTVSTFDEVDLIDRPATPAARAA